MEVNSKSDGEFQRSKDSQLTNSESNISTLYNVSSDFSNSAEFSFNKNSEIIYEGSVMIHPFGVNYKTDYNEGKLLGSGAFSHVYEVIHKKTSERRASKNILKSSSHFKQEYIKAEISILGKVHHPNIITLFEVYEDAEYFYLILEYVPGGELFDKIVSQETYSEVHAACTMFHIFAAICELHKHNVVHRDLKLENLLLTDNPKTEVKLTDFGLAYQLKSPTEKIFLPVGTPAYMAPETLRTHLRIYNGYGKEVDMWACGVILYILLSGRAPFLCKTNTETFKKILLLKEIEFPNTYWKGISSDGKKLVSRLLDPNPKTRITVGEALKHPWLTKCPNHHLHDTFAEIKKYYTKGFWKKTLGHLSCLWHYHGAEGAKECDSLD